MPKGAASRGVKGVYPFSLHFPTTKKACSFVAKSKTFDLLFLSNGRLIKFKEIFIGVSRKAPKKGRINVYLPTSWQNLSTRYPPRPKTPSF